RPFLALGRTDRGIPFASRRGFLTDVFFLICSTDDRGHLRTLARLSRLLALPTFLPELRGAQNAIEVQQVIAAGEGALPN
ncbi:MAG TPA: PTS sugar transporter subunit IIA, partial [Pirellulales bacterium]